MVARQPHSHGTRVSSCWRVLRWWNFKKNLKQQGGTKQNLSSRPLDGLDGPDYREGNQESMRSTPDREVTATVDASAVRHGLYGHFHIPSPFYRVHILHHFTSLPSRSPPVPSIPPPTFFSSLLFLFLHHMLAYNAKRIKNRKETKKRQHHAERESESSSDVMVQRWCLVPPPTAETGSRLCWWRRECAATQHTKQLKLKKKERNETRGEGKWNILWSQRVSVCVCGRLHYTRDLVALSPSGPPQFHPHSVFDMRQTRNYIFTPFW